MKAISRSPLPPLEDAIGQLAGALDALGNLSRTTSGVVQLRVMEMRSDIDEHREKLIAMLQLYAR